MQSNKTKIVVLVICVLLICSLGSMVYREKLSGSSGTVQQNTTTLESENVTVAETEAQLEAIQEQSEVTGTENAETEEMISEETESEETESEESETEEMESEDTEIEETESTVAGMIDTMESEAEVIDIETEATESEVTETEAIETEATESEEPVKEETVILIGFAFDAESPMYSTDELAVVRELCDANGITPVIVADPEMNVFSRFDLCGALSKLDYDLVMYANPASENLSEKVADFRNVLANYTDFAVKDTDWYLLPEGQEEAAMESVVQTGCNGLFAADTALIAGIDTPAAVYHTVQAHSSSMRRIMDEASAVGGTHLVVFHVGVDGFDRETIQSDLDQILSMSANGTVSLGRVR